jgi:aspartyl-tRNA(Asn)/glutamyl-tRNA(Gln) amidotransferase subunit A
MLGKRFYARSVRELQFMLRRGETTSLELTTAYLSRLEALGPKYNALVTLVRDQAISEASNADIEIQGRRYKSQLHGIPYGVKDLLAARGTPTTWGAEPYRTQKFKDDAEVVRRLREAGAVLIGKLSMVELAGGMGYDRADAAFNGPGKNPWNLRYWSGGSSSGPGSAVAAGPRAVRDRLGDLGLDPHAVVLLRRDGIAPDLRPRVAARRDGAVVDARQARAHGAHRRRLRPHPRRDRRARTRPTARRCRTASTGRSRRIRGSCAGGRGGSRCRRARTEKVQPAVRDNFEKALKALGGQAEITRDVPFPDLPWGPAVSTIVGAEGASAFLDLLSNGGLAKLRCARDRYAGYAGSVDLGGRLPAGHAAARRDEGRAQRAVHDLRRDRDAGPRVGRLPRRPGVLEGLAGRLGRAARDPRRQPVRAARDLHPDRAGHARPADLDRVHGAGLVRGRRSSRWASTCRASCASRIACRRTSRNEPGRLGDARRAGGRILGARAGVEPAHRDAGGGPPLRSPHARPLARGARAAGDRPRPSSRNACARSTLRR